MKLKALLSVCLAFIQLTSISGQNLRDELGSVLEGFGDALRTNDSNSAWNYLSCNFSVGMFSSDNALNILKSITDKTKIDALSLTEDDIVFEDGLVLAKARLDIHGNTMESVVAFDNETKIAYVDYFDALLGQSRYNESKLVATIPFENDGDYIILTIRINENEREMSFLFDTGADGMAITETLAKEIGLTLSHSHTASIVGGQTQVDISVGNTVHLADSLSLSGQSIAVFETIGEHDGIIGLNLLKRYIVNVDFDNGVMNLYNFGNYTPSDDKIPIPLKSFSSLVLLPCSLNITGDKAVTGNFIMDTGANYHLIAFSRFVRKNRLLLSGFEPNGMGTTVSMGHSTPVYYGKTREFRLADKIVFDDMPVTLQASSSGDNPSDDFPDGSIGIQLLSNYNFTIDLLRNELFLQERAYIK